MKIGFLGFGNMAQALAKGLLLKDVIQPEDLGATAVNIPKLEANTEALGIKAFPKTADLIDWADWVVLAVKPHQLANILPQFADALREKAVLNVAGGKTWDDIEALIPGVRHISSAPNLPLAVGEGIMILEYKHSLNDEDAAFLEETFGRIGLVEYLPTEQMKLTGTIGGCTPAYTAMFAESLIDAGVKHGLSRALAGRLVSQVLAGTAALLKDGMHPAVLKEGVCSPGGSTIKGVASLENAGFRGAVISAIDAAEGK